MNIDKIIHWNKLKNVEPRCGEFVLVLGYYIDENIEVKDRINYAWYNSKNIFIMGNGEPSWPVHYWIYIPDLPTAPKSIFDNK